jgi:hypothetical protein
MPEKINWTLNVQVVGGPKVAASDVLEVDAYDKIEAVIPAGASATVNVQPSGGAQFLLITASSYENLTYKVDASGTTVTLDDPHVLIGSGAVSLLGSTQSQFAFSNGSAADVTVNILVGRDATP